MQSFLVRLKQNIQSYEYLTKKNTHTQNKQTENSIK